jgi:two-component system sensor histidine kinase YesM
MLAIIVIIECIMMFLMYKTIVQPIITISKQAGQIKSVSTRIVNPVQGRKELSVLVDGINETVDKTKRLTEELDGSKMRLMEMEITALQAQNMYLQAQVNPHFLYNALECVCGMASQSGNMNIREMTHALSRLYRYCLGEAESTIGDELKCLEVYSEIIGYRYAQKHEIIVDVDPRLNDIVVPRMILEPLVENAMQHGFNHASPKRKCVTVRTSLDDGVLNIVISDNGCGMTAERINAINAQISALKENTVYVGTSIGIMNVAQRLKRAFGRDSGMVLSQNEEGGLTIRIWTRYPKNEKQ